MKCGSCEHTDGLYYPTDPAQVRCALTGEYHFYEHECDVMGTTSIIGNHIEGQTMYACMICGEGVPDAHGPAICEKCKEAVIKVRADLEKELWRPDEPDY